MIVKREKYYVKRINGNPYDGQRRKKTSFWLFGVIPLYVKDEVLSGDYEY